MKRKGKHRERARKHRSEEHHTSHKHLPQQSHHHHTHKLLYIITTLLVVLILAIIFSYPLYVQQPAQQTDISAVAITSATCSWKEGVYEICAAVSWKGAADVYAKPYIPGGESLDVVSNYHEEQFDYCQTVGSEGGYRIVRAMLFDDQGLLKDVGKGVSCENKPPTPISLAQKKVTYTHKAKTQIIAQQELTSRRTYAQGVHTVPFPDVVKSCTFSGTWVTDNDPWGRTRRYCHGATGSYTSYGDAKKQYVINDPDHFIWAGISKPKNDPLATRYEDHVLYMPTCYNLYYRDPKYYARAYVSGFSTSELTFHWEYFDDETQPQVIFNIAMDCTLERIT